eukprot:4783807-Pyramimonas_sp.AAC.1
MSAGNRLQDGMPSAGSFRRVSINADSTQSELQARRRSLRRRVRTGWRAGASGPDPSAPGGCG